MKNWRYSYLVLIHELVEMGLTKHRGISWKAIDKFDMDNPELDDPGSCPRAPYHKEHIAAEKVEKMMAEWLGINWGNYQKTFDSLKWKTKNVK